MTKSKKFFILFFFICLVFLKKSECSHIKKNNSINTLSNENDKPTKKRFNYGSLKKKFEIQTEEEKKETENKKNVEERFNPKSEYENCMSLVEKEFKNKTDEASLKLREELESLCIKKKEEDEMKLEKEKTLSTINKEENINKLTESEEKNRNMKSQLGISKSAQISNEILSESLAEIKNCYRNYDEKCPLNWKLDTDNNTCIAPDSYIGSCEKTLNMKDLDISEKKELEKKCSFFWKCDKKCVQDFDNYECPVNWNKIDDEHCQAPENYKGKCFNKMKFISMNNQEKLIYTNLCDIRWPCKEKCEHDYSVLCPEGWLSKNNEYCIASKLYKGNCEKVLNLKNFDRNMKEIYEQKCNFNYPCMNTCERNYDSLCPNLWNQVNANECSPSEVYDGTCKQNYIFKNNNIEEKKQFEKLCNVSYPCLQKCKRDYSTNCPIGWRETLTYCLAPNTYKYNCSKKIKKNMNESEKIHISQKCNVFWPCSNYEVLLKNLLYDNISEQDYLDILNGPVDDRTGLVINTNKINKI